MTNQEKWQDLKKFLDRAYVLAKDLADSDNHGCDIEPNVKQLLTFGIIASVIVNSAKYNLITKE